MTREDVELVLEWRNHPDIRRFMYTNHEIAPEEHSAWFGDASNNPGKNLLIVELRGVPSGFVQFSELRTANIAEWGFYVMPDAPKGSGKKLGVLALNHAFSVLRFHKVCGQALSQNTASVNFHRLLGFREEGVLRDQFFDGTNFHNVHCFGLLAEEWRNSAAMRENLR